MFFTLEKLEQRTRELERFRYRQCQCIAPFTCSEGSKSPDEVYTASLPEEFREALKGMPINIGDRLKGRDMYYWLEKEVTLPTKQDGAEVYGVFDMGLTGGGTNDGFESLLFIDGKPYQGVDSNHQDVNLNDLAGQTVRLTFLLWMGLALNDSMAAGRYVDPEHTIKRADIGYLDADTDEFYYLSKAIYKTLKQLDDDNPSRAELMTALNQAYLQIDWDEDCFYATVGKALTVLKSALDKMSESTKRAVTVYCVGHTHIDVAWLWRLKHTREKAIRSFSTVLRLMKEFDEYIFLQSQPQLYAYIKKDAPEIYEQIKQRVKSGQWEADGGMWLEADCNISSGEALVRQFLYGCKFLKDELDVECNYLWLPDVFGYSWALPQILKQCGIKTFMTTKISWNQFNTIPHDLFVWRGIDGTEIMSYLITTPEVGIPFDKRYATYNGMLSPRSVIGTWKKFRDKDLSKDVLISYGFGDGGGGVNRNMLKMRRAMDRIPALPNVKTVKAGEFFDKMHENLENTTEYVHTWDGELYLEYHRGTYTTQAHNKLMNRRTEFMAAQTEWLCSLSEIAGTVKGAYPIDELTQTWQTILRNQFHDILPGSSIHEVYTDARAEYEDVCKTLLNLQNAVTRPAENVYMIAAFFGANGVFIPETEKGLTFADANGKAIPAQACENGYMLDIQLPAMSTMTVNVTPSSSIPTITGLSNVDLDNSTIETPLYVIKWNKDGNIESLFDKTNNREVIKGLGNQLVIYEDKPMNFDAWDVDIYHYEKPEYAKLAEKPVLVENGALRTVIRFVFTYRSSKITQDMVLYKNSRRVDFVTNVAWIESHRILKAEFDVNVRSTKASYDIQFGHCERPTHWNTSWDYAKFEVCAHKWSDLSETGYGVALMNNCKYGYSTRDNRMQISLLRAPSMPDFTADRGKHTFTYSLYPHADSVSSGSDEILTMIKESLYLNVPASVLSGDLTEQRVIKSDNDAVAIDAFKKAENKKGYVVRLHERSGGKHSITLTSDFRIKRYQEINLLEQPIGDMVESSEIKTEFGNFEIKTFYIEME